jgi:hypothetical protein
MNSKILKHEALCYLLCYGVVVIFWLISLWPMMITDVWDESNIFLILQSIPDSLSDQLALAWGKYHGLYRPLASSLLLLLYQLGFGLVAMRYFNALLLIFSFAVLANTMIFRWNIDWRRALGFSITALFSSGSLITATWFANIFDASCLALIALGVSQLARERFFAAGILFGLAFYCKEIAILSIPLIPWIMWRSRCLSLRALVHCFVTLFSLAITYFVIRQHMVSLGSTGDIHQFTASSYWNSLLNMISGFWWQSTRFASSSLIGKISLFMTIAVVLMLDNWWDRSLYAVLLLLTSLACWGMFLINHEILISSIHFIGRLFLIPGTLILCIISSGRLNQSLWKSWIFTIPLTISAIETGINHIHFQEMYKQIYEQAALPNRINALKVNYEERKINDSMRRLQIGNFPDAELQVSPKDGCLLRKDGVLLFCAR